MSIISQLPEDHQAYFARLTERADDYKMVRTAPEDHWSPPWMVRGQGCFLVLLKEALAVKGNRTQPTGKYYLWCCGVDDTDCAIRDLTAAEAQNIFQKVHDGISQQALQDLGFVFGG